MQEENIFVQSEQQSLRPPGNGNNCHGHFRSIQAGGHGHWQGDSCGCDGQPSTPINMYVPILLILTLILIIKISKKKEMIMGKNKPKSKERNQELLEDKILVTVTVQFTVDTVLDSNMSPDSFGEMVAKHIYKTLPYEERTHYDVDTDVWEEIKK